MTSCIHHPTRHPLTSASLIAFQERCCRKRRGLRLVLAVYAAQRLIHSRIRQSTSQPASLTASNQITSSYRCASREQSLASPRLPIHRQHGRRHTRALHKRRRWPFQWNFCHGRHFKHRRFHYRRPECRRDCPLRSANPPLGCAGAGAHPLRQHPPHLAPRARHRDRQEPDACGHQLAHDCR